MIPSPITSCPPPRLLVGGGAGYVGSRMAKHLLRRGCDIVMFDNQSTMPIIANNLYDYRARISPFASLKSCA